MCCRYRPAAIMRRWCIRRRFGFTLISRHDVSFETGYTTLIKVQTVDVADMQTHSRFSFSRSHQTIHLWKCKRFYISGSSVFYLHSTGVFLLSEICLTLQLKPTSCGQRIKKKDNHHEATSDSQWSSSVSDRVLVLQMRTVNWKWQEAAGLTFPLSLWSPSLLVPTPFTYISLFYYPQYSNDHVLTLNDLLR